MAVDLRPLSVAEATAFAVSRRVPDRLVGVDAGVLRRQADLLDARARLALAAEALPAARDVLAATAGPERLSLQREALRRDAQAAVGRHDAAMEEVERAGVVLERLGVVPVDVAGGAASLACEAARLRQLAIVVDGGPATESRAA